MLETVGCVIQQDFSARQSGLIELSTVDMGSTSLISRAQVRFFNIHQDHSSDLYRKIQPRHLRIQHPRFLQTVHDMLASQLTCPSAELTDYESVSLTCIRRLNNADAETSKQSHFWYLLGQHRFLRHCSWSSNRRAKHVVHGAGCSNSWNLVLHVLEMECIILHSMAAVNDDCCVVSMENGACIFYSF